MTTTVGRIVEQLWPSWLRFSNVGAGGEFDLRADIPGVDPARDIRIWLSGDMLRVEVTRVPVRDDQVRSEFHYGRSAGAVDLPRHVDPRRLSATYNRGVLRIASPAAATKGCPVAIDSGLPTM
jgi:HSP20 family protein